MTDETYSVLTLINHKLVDIVKELAYNRRCDEKEIKVIKDDIAALHAKVDRVFAQVNKIIDNQQSDLSC